MDKKTFILAALFILIIIPTALAAFAQFKHAAFAIGDGKDINLSGNAIGNGTVRNIYCTENCTGYFNSTSIGTETNATNLTTGFLNESRFKSMMNYTHRFNYTSNGYTASDVDSAGQTGSTHFIGDRANTSASRNWAFSVFQYIANMNLSGANENAAIYAHTRTAENSTYYTHDAVGIDVRGESVTNTGRVWGQYVEARQGSGNNQNFLVSQEVAIINADEQSGVDQTNSSYGTKYLVSRTDAGKGNGTTAVMIDSGDDVSKWHNGIFATADGILSNFLNYQGIFSVSNTGIITAKTPAATNNIVVLDTTDANTVSQINFKNAAASKWQIGSRGTIDTPNNRFAMYNATTQQKLFLEQDGGLTLTNYSGTGNDYACFDPNGKIFRSDSVC